MWHQTEAHGVYVIPWWLIDTLKRNKKEIDIVSSPELGSVISVYEYELLLATQSLVQELLPQYRFINYRDYYPNGRISWSSDSHTHAKSLLAADWTNRSLNDFNQPTYYWSPRSGVTRPAYLIVNPGFIAMMEKDPLPFLTEALKSDYAQESLYKLCIDYPYLLESYIGHLYKIMFEQGAYNGFN